MKKQRLFPNVSRGRFCLRFIFVLSLFLVTSSHVAVHAAPENTQITFEVKKVTLDQVLQTIGEKSDYYMLYKVSDVAHVKDLTLDIKNLTVEEALKKALEGTGLTYTIENRTIMVHKSGDKPQKPAAVKKDLSGTVVDSRGEPLAGVSVIIGNRGAITDAFGQFHITDVTVGSTVRFQFIGMKTIEKVFRGDGEVDVTLEDDAAEIGGVIVTGFGVIKKEAYAGSASMVNVEEMADIPVTNVTSLLTGTASGVEVSSSGGGPGGLNDIRIRGIGSISASSSPLIVIDGVPMRSGSIGTTSSSNTSNFDAMATINPSDIESMTVIKDAAAASLYGSRAANGVILITTKTGKKGAAKINFRQDIGFSDLSIDYRPYLDNDERYDFIYEGMRRAVMHNGYIPDGYGDRPNEVDRTPEGATRHADEMMADNKWIVQKRDENGNPVWTDWKDELFRKGLAANSELSISGATDKFNYYASLGYSKQEGITTRQELDRYAARINVQYKALDVLTVGANIAFTSTLQDYGYDNMGYYSPIYSNYHKITSSDPIFDEEGQYNRNLASNGRRNPIAAAKYDVRNRNVKRYTASTFAELKLLPELKLRSTLSYDYTTLVESSYDHPLGSDWPDDGSASKTFRNTGDLISSTNLNFVKQFGSDHTLDALVAYEVSRVDRDRAYAQRKGFLDPDKHEVSIGSEVSGASGYFQDYRMVSVVSRVNYDFRDKIYLGASYRTDGTSRYLADNRWGHFWSASAGWRFTSEPFMAGLRNVLYDGRIRASYGVNGNLTNGYYDGIALFSLGRYNEANTMYMGSLVADDLRWEKNQVFNLGLDLDFIGRINLAIDFYDRRTSDLLLNVPVTLTSGFTSKMMNIGKVLNRGLEVSIDTRNIVKKDFSWSTNFNFSTNYNEVLKLDGDSEEMTVSGNNLARIGNSYYNYYLVEFAGIDPANGMPVFYTNKPDENGNLPNKKNLYNEDGTLNTAVGTYDRSAADEVLTDKSALPKLTGGLSNTFRYKWFDLNFLFTFSLGGWSHDSAMQKSRTAGSGDSPINQIPAAYRNSWKQPGDNASVEGWFWGNHNNQMTGSSTARLHRTDHIRLKNLSFGVTLPKHWSQKVGLSKIRFFMSGSNLLTWAKNDIYDPETPVNGSVAYETPQLKTMTFGIDLTF